MNVDLDLDLSDRVSLAPGVRLEGAQLHDELTARAIAINSSAADCLGWLGDGMTVGQVAATMVARYGIEEDRAKADLRALVSELDRHALVRVRRNLRVRLAPFAIAGQALRYLTLDWPRQPARRYPPTVAALARAAARASRWGYLGAAFLSIALFVLATQAGGQTGGSVPDAVALAAVPPLLYTVLVGQLLAHEVGHMVAIRRLSDATHYIATRGLRLSIAHAGAGRFAQRVIAIAGPLAGLLSGALIAAGVLLAGLDAGLAWLSVAVAATHLYSLAPWAADGRMLWRPRSSPSPSGGEAAERAR